MGLYDRDYMKWTDEERERYFGAPATARRARGAFLAACATLAALLAAGTLARLHVPLLRHERPAAPIGCVGPSSLPCPPGTVRVRDPNDPNNPHEWPNDLPHGQQTSSSV